MVGIWCDSDSDSSALQCWQARPRSAGAGEASSDSCERERERMYGRSRTRDHQHYPHTDLSSLLSEGSSSTASTRERLLQGRWRGTSEETHRERRNNRYCGSLSPHRDFSDTSSVSTLRNSDPDTCRSFSSSSSLSHWSAGPDPSRRYRPLNISRTRSFQSVQPASPSPDRRTFRQEDDFTFDEYKSLSAQDFRKGIRREERLALDSEDDRLSSNLDLESQDQDLDRGSLRSGRFSPTVIIRENHQSLLSEPRYDFQASLSSLGSFNYNPPPVEDLFPLRHLSLLDSTNKEKVEKLENYLI